MFRKPASLAASFIFVAGMALAHGDTAPRAVDTTGLPDLPGAFYALGYGGNGVMYSAMAGRRMAQLVAGERIPNLPIFNEELPHEGWRTPFRRLGQWGLYHLYHYRDERA